jgi:hypothetical protein
VEGVREAFNALGDLFTGDLECVIGVDPDRVRHSPVQLSLSG